MSEEQKPVEEVVVTPVVETKVEAPVYVEHYRCSNCRMDLSKDMVTKLALDYKKNDDGSLSAGIARFSVFCKACNFFITILDPEASKQLQDIANRVR